ncbi:hypothetical protein GUJ93_ZPchr0010g10250 [Zizania palustris]|uniref:Uncharacterized protein n=1 Tax=Zizania palustris TaxID=103762 RepID=A0A8J5W947_ZIZPA|nr:hypothetical protein GUJ93_ZPchr0010g10250 [Zizania palustris]
MWASHLCTPLLVSEHVGASRKTGGTGRLECTEHCLHARVARSLREFRLARHRAKQRKSSGTACFAPPAARRTPNSPGTNSEGFPEEKLT